MDWVRSPYLHGVSIAAEQLCFPWIAHVKAHLIDSATAAHVTVAALRDALLLHGRRESGAGLRTCQHSSMKLHCKE